MPPNIPEDVGWQSFQLLAAGRRNKAIHAQVFHHLPVVIVGVGHRVNGGLKTRPWAGRGVQGFQHISFTDGSHSPMQLRERSSDLAHDLGLAFDRIGCSLIMFAMTWVLTQYACCQLVVGC